VIFPQRKETLSAVSVTGSMQRCNYASSNSSSLLQFGEFARMHFFTPRK